MGPLTRISGASVWPDTCMSRWFISGWAMHSRAASRMGNCAGWQPAITALMATFSTVARPKPGSMTMTTSCGSRRVPLSMASTAAGVGGTMGIPSLQSRSSMKRFTASRPRGVSSSSTVKTSVSLWPLAAPERSADADIRVSPRMMLSICSSTILWM